MCTIPAIAGIVHICRQMSREICTKAIDICCSSSDVHMQSSSTALRPWPFHPPQGLHYFALAFLGVAGAGLFGTSL